MAMVASHEIRREDSRMEWTTVIEKRASFCGISRSGQVTVLWVNAGTHTGGDYTLSCGLSRGADSCH